MIEEATWRALRRRSRRSRKRVAKDRPVCRDLVDVLNLLVLAERMCRDSRTGGRRVRPSQPPGVDQVGDRRRPVRSPRPACDLYRRRARDWDPGFRTEGSLSRVKHAGAVHSPSLSATLVDDTLRLFPYSPPPPAGASPALALRGG